VNIIK